MRYLLSRASRPVLARLAQERTLCAFDFDGTLAPIAAHPGEAVLRDRTRNLLARLAALYPCVILSGRSRADLMDKLQGSGIERFIGSHGAETQDSKRNRHPQLRRWKAAIESELCGSPGLWIEDKGLSLAVHYRQAPRKAEAKRRILRATQNLEQARVFGGKQVVNLTVDGDPHKGIALAAERERLACNWVLYVGDDENDEEAFAIGGNLVGVRVGKRSHTHAGYYLRSQGEIDSLLETLIALRESMPPPA
ncbi:MAG TPA: trehalose-phosphatase [Bryobacteraceae bacterium]|nr:trehalose-phosphatase [Bryobacteraceae bacterium]